jgi:hypothetical protein
VISHHARKPIATLDDSADAQTTQIVRVAA